MIHIVGSTKNNIPIYVDLVASEAAKHIGRQPHLLTLAAEALQNTTLDKIEVRIEYDMKRIIGYDFVVKTGANDTVFYVQLVKDPLYTRFIKNGKPQSTSFISMILQRHEKGDSYSLHDVWIGHLTPPRPGSVEETAKSQTYWKEHAFVFENQPIQPRTLTKISPY